jgi:hypothetical protein
MAHPSFDKPNFRKISWLPAHANPLQHLIFLNGGSAQASSGSLQARSRADLPLDCGLGFFMKAR